MFHVKQSVILSMLSGMAISGCGAAYAQSSVTLYGIVDGGLLYQSKTLGSNGQSSGKNFQVMDSGTEISEFGLRGDEDLGGGLKVTFDLESGISVANGGFNDSNGNLFGRQAWVALGGNFGQVKLGMQFSPFFIALYEDDPRGFAPFGSSVVNYVDNVLGTAGFNANAISYATPSLGGWKGSVMLALGGEAGDFQAGRQYSASLTYEGGSLMVNTSIYSGNSGGTVQTPIPTTVAFWGRTVGASYRFGSLTVKGSFTNYNVAGSFDNNVYGGGLDYFVTPFIDLNAGVTVTSDRGDTANHSVLAAVGANYFLSKRTTLYAQAGMVNNHGAMNTGLAISGTNTLYGVPGTTVGVNIGMSHSF